MVEQDTTIVETEVGSKEEQVPTFDDILKFVDKDVRSSKTLEAFKGKKLDEALPQLLKNYVHAQQLTGKKVGLFSEDEIRQFVDLPVRPKSAEDYKEAILDVDMELVDKFKEDMYSMGLDTRQAEAFLKKQAELAKVVQESQGLSKAEQAEAAENELHEKFGLQYRKALDIAKQAADSLGGEKLIERVFNAEVKDPLMIEALYKIGKEIGAGKVSFKETPAATVPKDLKSERSKLMLDPEFRQAYMSASHPGHKAAVEKMKALYE